MPESESKEERVRRFGRAISRSPYAVYERLIRGGGFLTNILKWFFSWGILLLLIAVIIVVIVGASIFFVRCSQTGSCGVVLSSIFGGIERTTVGRAAERGAITIFDYIFNPDKVAESLVLTWGETKVEEEEFGVKITDIEVEEALYFVGDPISVVVTMNVKAPREEDIVIDFSTACELQDYDGEVVVSGPFTNENEITVLADTEDDFDVTCKFLDGFDDIEKDISRKKITFKPSYGFIQDVEWYVESKYGEYAGDERIGPSRSIKKGPMIFSLYSKSRQPFYVGRSYKLFLELENNKLVWRGRLDKLENIELRLPFEVELITDEFCDFEEKSASGSYKTYVLREEVLEKANIDCNLREFLNIYDLTTEDCISLLKDNVRTSCEFKFLDAEEEVSVGLPFIGEVSYTYIAEDITFVNIRAVGF